MLNPASEMRIITLWQPWASLIALGLKQYETRDWSTNYRGKLAIHAAKRDYGLISPEAKIAAKACELAGWGKFERRTLNFLGNLHPSKPRGFSDLPFGAIVAIADLTDCREMIPFVPVSPIVGCSVIPIPQQTELEKTVGDWQRGRYAWKLENVRPLDEPIPYKGGRGLQVLDDLAVLLAIAGRLGGVVNA